MSIDKERVKKDSKFIRDSIKKLEILNRLSEEEFLGNFKNVDSSKYLLRTSIEAMVDLSNYVVIANGWGLPENIEKTFKMLCEKKIMNNSSFEEYMELINLKDKLTFMYATIDDDFIYKEMKKSIKKLQNIDEEIKKLA